MTRATYIVSEGNRSAFWTYEYLDDQNFSVKYTYGRLGLPPSSLSPPTIKPHTSAAHREKEVGKKITEKLRKGYKLQTEEQVKQEQDIAGALGAQYKINSIKFVGSQSGRSFEFSSEYDPNRGVIVEIINSWSKETNYIFMNRTDAWSLDGCSTTAGGIFTCTRLQDNYRTNWVDAIKKRLRDTAEILHRVVTQKFATLGVRKLTIGDDEDDENMMIAKDVVATAMASSNIGNVSEQVLFQFAALGARKLEI